MIPSGGAPPPRKKARSVAARITGRKVNSGSIGYFKHRVRVAFKLSTKVVDKSVDGPMPQVQRKLRKRRFVTLLKI
jgi:hypothetical protein